MQRLSRIFFTPLLLCCSFAACANGTTIDKLLSAGKPPAGVVIEIVTGEARGLDWALPQAKAYISKLRQKFPNLPIAIVSHGREQFALQIKKQASEQKIHSLTQSLQKDNVQLHVCGTHAGWRGVSEEDFPGYVNVAPVGPTQIKDYLALDYQLLIIKRRNTP